MAMQVTIHTGDAFGQGCAPPGALIFEIHGSEGRLSSAQCSEPQIPPESHAPSAVAARRRAAVAHVLQQLGLLDKACVLQWFAVVGW